MSTTSPSRSSRVQEPSRALLQALLGALFGAFFTWSWTAPAPGPSSPEPPPLEIPNPEPPGPRVAALQSFQNLAQVSPKASDRNLFAFPQAPQDSRIPVESLDLGREPEAGREPKITEPTEAKMPEIQLLGTFGPKDRRIAVVKSPELDHPTNVLSRDLVQERFRVEQVSPVSIQLREVQEGDETFRVEIGPGRGRGR